MTQSNRARRIALASALTLATLAGSASAQLRVVTWNISLYNGGRTADIQTVTYGVNGANGLSMRPDIILLQEIVSSSALAAFVSALNTAPGSPGDWTSSPFVAGPDNQNCMVYRTSKVTYLGAVLVSTGGATPEPPRNTFRYSVRPAGYSAASTSLALYSSHMKAQDTGTDDDARRLLEAQRIRDDAQALPAGWNFIYGGDTNIQSASSAEYQELVGSQANNLGRFFDPINRPGSWNNSATYQFIHTQDPAGTGGMDDRHDQLLISANLFDGTGLDYVGNPATPVSLTTWNDPNHSYRAWGNDGTSFNLTMTTTGNTMVGATIAQSIINCAGTGGHIPVLLDMRVPAKVTSTTTVNFGQVALNSTANQLISVSNAGDTALWTAGGIQTLSYTLAASAGFTAPGGSFLRTPGSGGLNHTISMNTSTLGVKVGTITITSNDPDQPTRVINVTGEVISANQAPVANAGPDQTLTDTDDNGSESVTLDGSASTDDHGVTNYKWDEGLSTLAQGPSATSVVVLPVGVHTITLTVSDSSLLTGTDQVVITIDPAPPCPADLDDGTGTGTPDNGVDISDLLFFLNRFEAGDIPNADLDNGSNTGTPDGGVDINDLLYFLAHFEAGC